MDGLMIFGLEKDDLSFWVAQLHLCSQLFKGAKDLEANVSFERTFPVELFENLVDKNFAAGKSLTQGHELAFFYLLIDQHC